MSWVALAIGVGSSWVIDEVKFKLANVMLGEPFPRPGSRKRL